MSLPSPASPLVSVIVPAYQAAEYLDATLASALAQSHALLEVIVTDDGSTDGTAAAVEAAAARDPRVRLIRQSNAGVAAARNTAIRAAAGSLIAPLDADDLWHPDKLAHQVRRLHEAGPEVGLVYTDFVSADLAGNVLPTSSHDLPEGDLSDTFVYRNPIPCASTPLIRRAALERVGLYDGTLQASGAPGCEDWDLYLRLAEHTHVAVVPLPLVVYRRVPGSMSTHPARMKASYEAMIARLCDRRPHLPRYLLQRSRFRFALYLAGIHRQRGARGAAARETLRATGYYLRWQATRFASPRDPGH